MAFSYTSYDRIDEDGEFIRQINCKPRLTYIDLLRNNYIHCLTAIYDAEKLGIQFMPLLRKRQDWALWLKLIKKCGEAWGLQESLGFYRVRSGSISSNKFEMVKYNWFIYHKIEGFGKVRSTFQLFIFLFFYVKKKIKGE